MFRLLCMARNRGTPIEPPTDPEKIIHRNRQQQQQQEVQKNPPTTDYALPNLDTVQGSITRPTITINTFEIKPAMTQMIQYNVQFRGIFTEDLNQHLKWFLQLCDTFKFNEVIDDVICLRLFPFILIDNAFSWLDSHAPRSITTWNKLVEKFLHKFFPISKIVQHRREITTFKQLEG
ncbi:reverse transcriptase [Gossypium australe]|uniref:Reverse transcriptase n=1 Tax=Gossypium australe TaxID=47621 RepID=A0A5B6VPS8_9ROSI|nr:reverse transcriptase [Gossypium australe]